MTAKENGGVDCNRPLPEIPAHAHAADDTAPPENGKPAKPTQSTQDRFSGRAPCSSIEPVEPATQRTAKPPVDLASWFSLAKGVKPKPTGTRWRGRK